MSTTKEMYDRFFRGSKYEWKWKSGQLSRPVSSADLAVHRQRLAEDRRDEPPKAASNPFERPNRREVA